MFASSKSKCAVPEERQEEGGHHTDHHDGVDNGPLVQHAWSEAVHERDEERPDVGHLDNVVR